MKEITMKSGTRAEILEYLRAKGIKTITVNSDASGDNKVWSETPNPGEYFVFSHNSIEMQMDNFINEGSPVVSICISQADGKACREQFFVTDYASIRTDMEIEKLDDSDIRERRINAIKTVMAMELDAEERWDRILKIVDQFRGVSFAFGPV